jgi:small subunit ribosomal protein S5
MRSKDMVKETTLAESTGLFTKVVTIGRVSRMTGQGRKQQFRALVVLGNGKGAAGFGVGKGLNPRSALTSAIREGEKDLVFVDVAPWGALYHDIEGKRNNTRVVIKAIEPNKWYATGGRLMKAIMDCVGISSYSCVVIGRRNPFTIVNAAFDALGKHQTPKEVAMKRGRKLVETANTEVFASDSLR